MLRQQWKKHHCKNSRGENAFPLASTHTLILKKINIFFYLFNCWIKDICLRTVQRYLSTRKRWIMVPPRTPRRWKESITELKNKRKEWRRCSFFFTKQSLTHDNYRLNCRNLKVTHVVWSGLTDDLGEIESFPDRGRPPEGHTLLRAFVFSKYLHGRQLDHVRMKKGGVSMCVIRCWQNRVPNEGG